MKAFIKDNVWVWAGALIVLYTLSGSVQKIGIWISATAFLTQCLFHALRGDDE